MVIARTLLVSLLFACGIGAASCSMRFTGGSPGVVGAHATPGERQPWSRRQQLSWGDFAAVAPPVGGADAVTVYAISWKVRCTAAGLESEAVANFFPHLSWVKTAVLLDPRSSSQLLRHERAHFDLAEVFARTMRRFFATAYQPCTSGDDSVRSQGWEFEQGSLLAQMQYDDDTYNGRELQMQGRWEDTVAHSLALLELYGSQIDMRYWIHGTAR
jgi:hypothetical protein